MTKHMNRRVTRHWRPQFVGNQRSVATLSLCAETQTAILSVADRSPFTAVTGV